MYHTSLAARTFLTEDELMIQETARKYLVEQVEPNVGKLESDGAPSAEMLKSMGDLGLFGTMFPEEYGGTDVGLMSWALIAEQVARVNAGLDMSLFAQMILVARNLMKHGTEEQKQKYLVPLIKGEKFASFCVTEPKGGSDALSPLTKAVRDGEGWRITGSKTFITNAPVADFFLVFTRTSGEARQASGGTCFIVDKSAEGLSTGKPFEKMCMKSSPTGEVFLDNVYVDDRQILGEEGNGFFIMLDGLDTERVFEGASLTGIGQACLDVSIPYAQERVVFGKPIIRNQLIQEKIAGMAAGVEISRTMFYHLVRACERGEKVTGEASMLKLYASEVAMDASRDAVQILGGYGLVEEYGAARLYRDAKHHEIGAGTSEVQKIIISREAIKSHAS